MNWMNKNGSASDHGHSGSELVGVFFPNDKSYKQLIYSNILNYSQTFSKLTIEKS